jgi:hypothetical protein
MASATRGVVGHRLPRLKTRLEELIIPGDTSTHVLVAIEVGDDQAENHIGI